MKSNTHTQDLQDDKVAALGIGALIVFIALILVAAVAAAVIIQTAEQLQQNAQKTGDDTADNMAGKLMINSVYVSTADADNYVLYVRLAPGSEPTPTDSISFQLFCDDIVDDVVAAADVAPMTTGVAGVATMQPSTGYVLTIDASDAAVNDCSAGAVGVGNSAQLYIHIGSGGTTYETLTVDDTTQGARVV
jgi:flagellin FlaB